MTKTPEISLNKAHHQGGELALQCSVDGRVLARVLADSKPPQGARLTTLEIVIPRIVLAELNTHRVLSRNSASSRAIPVEKMLKRVEEDPYIPETWGRNRSGMQATEALTGDSAAEAEKYWLLARDCAVESARNLLEVGVHKQTTNRLLEPFMWHTVLITATEWDNFRHLRTHPDAHPAIQRTAVAMEAVLEANEPRELDWHGWHLPLIREIDVRDLAAGNPDAEVDELGLNLAKISSARCARVSYLTHNGVRSLSEDFKLHDRLLGPGHMSPLEHPAQARLDPGCFPLSNFSRPWVQYRKMIPYEHDIHADPERGEA